ncbi:MAG: Rieske 2Fe-2S domain-containing protein [Planctomycetaceae bacterium]
MSDKKPSTNDILSRIRGGAAASKPADEKPDTPPVEPSAAEETQAAPAASEKKPAGPAPTGTSSILASIKGGGAAKPAGSSAPPAGTSSILASIKGGGAAKPAGGASPKAGGSVLDAIRSGGAGAAPKAAPTKPKAAAAATADVDTKAAAGMSAAEMIRAARQGVVTKDPGTGDPFAVPAKPALPKKPLVKPAPKAPTETRRSAFGSIVQWCCSPVVIAWSAFTAATAISSLAMARFMMPNVLVEPPTKFKIGPLTDYGAGTVSTKWKAQFAVWIVNDDIDGQQMIYALSTVCTHLGCTPNWLEGEQKFKCPCHGSGFYKTGINFEGPAPRPLERYAIRIAEDGMLEVDKSVKFQRELGQWENTASYVPV